MIPTMSISTNSVNIREVNEQTNTEKRYWWFWLDWTIIIFNYLFLCKYIIYILDMYDILNYVIIPYSLSFFMYWFLCLIFFILDKNVNTKYRIEYNIDWKLYEKTIYHVLYLQFI